MSTLSYLVAALNGTAFYVLGSGLTVLALAVTAIGLRSFERFPSKAATGVSVALFAVLVLGTAYFAVAYSEDEQAHREAELAAEEAEEGATEEPAGGESPAPEQPAIGPGEGGAAGERQEEQGSAGGQPSAGGPGGTLMLAADPTQIAYDKSSLQSRPGEVTIDFDNPAQVGHDVAIEQGSRQIAKTDVITDSETSVSTQLAPGRYVFYCTVPGHREAGMQGTLTVR